MNQPKRWLDSAPNPKIRELLRSGLTDAPDPQALPRTAAALGLGTAVVVASGSAAAFAVGSAGQGALASSATGVSATGAALSASSASASASALVVGKWLAAGFLAGGVASAGLVASQAGFGPQSDEASQSASVAAGQAAVPARARGGAATPSTRVQALPFAVEQEAAPAAASEPSSRANTSPTRVTSPPAKPVGPALAAPGEPPFKSAETRGALAAEIAWIDSARRALSSGDVDRSLAELDAFERARTLGVLDREAELLRLDALRKKGDIAAARRVAERYLGAFPGDAHAPRLREFLSHTESKR